MADEGILFIYGGLSGQDTVFPHWPASLKGLSVRGWVASAIWGRPDRYARAQNLFNARYEEIFSFRAQPFIVYAGLRVRLSE